MGREKTQFAAGKRIAVLLIAVLFAITSINYTVKAEEFTSIVMTYQDKVFTRQLYSVDTDKIKEGVVTDGLKSIGELCDNLKFQTNGSVEVDREAVMNYVKAAIIAGQRSISVDLTQFTPEMLAQSATTVANVAAVAVNNAVTANTTVAAAPLISNEALNAVGIDCKIAEASTKFNAGQDRAVNIRTAASKINGLIIQPGMAFSANLMFGPRTIENGYGLGNVISGDTYVKGIGGGICQVSSTLNLAVLRSGIIPIERHNHSHRSTYIASGLDATISSGTLDYQFINTLPYPIYILANADGGVLTIAIYSNHNATSGMTFEPNVVGGALQNTTYLVGKLNGVPLTNVRAYSSNYKQ